MDIWEGLEEEKIGVKWYNYNLKIIKEIIRKDTPLVFILFIEYYL